MARTKPARHHVARGTRPKILRKHMSVSGMPGSGKTTFLMGLLVSLAILGIPFILFEPGRSEYRLLKCLKAIAHAAVSVLAKALRIYTPGNERVSPIRLNPFWRPPGVSVNEHIQNLMACFKGAVAMEEPLPSLLQNALALLYHRHPHRDHPPTMSGLLRTALEVLAARHYPPDVHNTLSGAIKSRLEPLAGLALGRMFKCDHGIPALPQLMGGFSVIELAALEEEHACLWIQFILMQIREYIKATPWTGQGVRLVLIVEEAHALVGRDTNAKASDTNADPRAFASRSFCRLLLEFRALGVAVIIIDQHPSNVAADVIKAPCTKIAFRQVAGDDREELANAMLLGPVEMENLARLKPGEAYFFTEGYFRPLLIQTLDLRKEWNMPEPPVGEAILPWIRDDEWFREAAQARVGAELGELLDAMSEYQKHLANTAQRAQALAKAEKDIRQWKGPRRDRYLAAILRKATLLRSELEESFEKFDVDAYWPLSDDVLIADIADDDLRTVRDGLVHRYETKVKPKTAKCLQAIVRLIERCTPLYPGLRGV